MDVEDAILKRRSVRDYEEREVPEEKLEAVLEAGRMAPSAYNNQDWIFVVVKDDEKRKRLFEAAKEQKHVNQAPVVIAGVSTDPSKDMPNDVSGGIVDISIALDHMTLRAAEGGLGTCWIGNFRQESAKEALAVPEDQKIVSMITLGYPKESLKKTEKERKSLDDIVSFDSL